MSTLIGSNDLDKALRLIHRFVQRIVTEPLCASHVLASKTLDELCQRIGCENFAGIAVEKSRENRERPVVVYIVTKLQKSGGHTRVIEDFIKLQHECRQVILSTELDGRSDQEYVDHSIARHANVEFEQSPKGNHRDRLTWLQRRLVALNPDKTYLFNHHQDSVAVASLQPTMGLDAVFYHHGDHHLCLGVHLAHTKHIDPHPMGYHYCRDVMGIKNIYVPLTVEDKGDRRAEPSFRSTGALNTCTAARSNHECPEPLRAG